MRTDLECVDCFMRQALAAAKLSTGDSAVHRLVLHETGRLLSNLDLSLSPPENAVAVYGLIAELTGAADPFEKLKAESNAFAMQLRDKVSGQITGAANPLYAAVRYAIAGNIIDYGSRHDFDASHSLSQCLEDELHINDFSDLEREVRGKDELNILYLADNCGEIVFDGLLVEQLQQLGHRVAVAVRGEKILNDATVETASEVGLDTTCTVISSGSACPGTPVQSCSDELRHAFARADLIISKGQGNFETLSEADGPIYFLLTVKCAVVARHIVSLAGLPADAVTGKGELVLMKREKYDANAAD